MHSIDEESGALLRPCNLWESPSLSTPACWAEVFLVKAIVIIVDTFIPTHLPTNFF